MPTEKEVMNSMGKTMHAHMRMTAHKSEWKGLKLTIEEMLYIKYMYHDIQEGKLHEFMASFQKHMNEVAEWTPAFVDEKRHLTPYIMIHKKELTHFWLVTYNLNMFNLSFHKVESGKHPVITGGNVALTADEAVQFFLKWVDYYEKRHMVQE